MDFGSEFADVVGGRRGLSDTGPALELLSVDGSSDIALRGDLIVVTRLGTRTRTQITKFRLSAVISWTTTVYDLDDAEQSRIDLCLSDGSSHTLMGLRGSIEALDTLLSQPAL